MYDGHVIPGSQGKCLYLSQAGVRRRVDLTDAHFLQVLYTISKVVDLDGRPYIPGFLSFRETGLAELILELVADPAGRATPQVLFVDGNGRLHPRQAGSAVAIGIKTGLPTIGVGTSPSSSFDLFATWHRRVPATRARNAKAATGIRQSRAGQIERSAHT